MTEPVIDAELPESESPAPDGDDPSETALDYTRDEGTPRADSWPTDAAPTPPPASLPSEPAPAATEAPTE